MISYLRRSSAARQLRDDNAVLDAIRMLRPSRAYGFPIARLARLSPSRTNVALARLEEAGQVTSDWADGPWPRRRLYKVQREVAR